MTDESTSFSPDKDAQSSLEQSEPTTLKKKWSNVAQMLKANEKIKCTNQFNVKSVDLISLKNSRIYVNNTLVCYT